MMADDMRWVHEKGKTGAFLKMEQKISRTRDSFEDFFQESIDWCNENNLTYWRASYDTIRFTKDSDLIAFLLRFG